MTIATAAQGGQVTITLATRAQVASVLFDRTKATMAGAHISFGNMPVSCF
jgi:hypothetical protein